MTLHVQKATVLPVNSTECLAMAQGCCSHGRHMDCKQHIWDWDRQKLACSCTIDNTAKFNNTRQFSSSHCCHGAQTIFATIHADIA